MFILWVNSWVDIDTALSLCEERVDLSAFATLLETQEEKAEAGLIQAYHALKNLTFRVKDFNNGLPFRPALLTEAERNNLTADFLYCFKMAQVLEADSLLGTSENQLEVEADKRRRAGIIQETIGQSSTKYANIGSSPNESKVKQRTMDMLSSYLDRTVRIGRA